MERPDLLVRLDAAAEAIRSLNTLLAAEESLDDVLKKVALNAVRAVSDADAVSITELQDEPVRTAASTDDGVVALDQEQYDSGRGPCLEAARTRQPVRVTMRADGQRWPEFVEAARAAGVHATLSIPLIVPSPASGEDELVGSLNAYSRSTEAFDVIDEKIMGLYTEAAARAIAEAHRWQRLRDTVEQLETALTSRTEIDQAKGVLRTLYGGTADDAFARMVDRSQRENVKLRDIALRILAEVDRRGED
ncbi:GAF and ANTAR domain-containing protein [Mycolicibacterium sediminis]|uniref:GAF and ANTAR domain-containing protein n=1 Tax=Mycolicibacterium sediminis TaxID=1286180 RepID=UPI001FE4431E|nr:GAF and ANTAR domain-containing protein [Mycolicibacterium sediminis]